MKRDIYDVIIVGAGPAGLSAAISLTEAKYRVLIVDQHTFPRDKVCGDGLTEESIEVLEELGCLDDILKEGFSTSKVIINPFKDKCCSTHFNVITIKRYIFDDILFQHAINGRASFQQGKFTGKYKLNSDSVAIEIQKSDSSLKEQLHAKYVILSIGAQNDYSLKNCTKIKLKKSSTIGARGYYRADWPIRELNIFYFEEMLKTAIYVFPLGNNLFNVGCCRKIGGEKLDIKQFIRDFVENDLNKKYKTNGVWEQPLKGAFLRTGLSNLDHSVDGRVILSGEACGTTNPFSGEGIANALKSGLIAGKVIEECLESGNPEKIVLYKKRLKRVIKKIQWPYLLAEKVLVIRVIRNWFYSNLCKLQEAKEHNCLESVCKKKRMTFYIIKKIRYVLIKR